MEFDEKLMDKLILEQDALYEICDISRDANIDNILSAFIILWETKKIAKNTEQNIDNFLKDSSPELQVWFKSMADKFKIINFSRQDYSNEPWYGKIKYIMSLKDWEPFFIVFL